MSVIDFTDSANPTEIAFFDRGPINPVPDPDPTNPNRLNLGGLWSTYWYNGIVYGTEIARGFDTFGLLAERPAVGERDRRGVGGPRRRVQRPAPDRITWAPSFNVAGSFFDQAVRAGTLDDPTARQVGKDLAQAEKQADRGNDRAAVAHLDNAIRRVGEADEALTAALVALADSLRS